MKSFLILGILIFLIGVFSSLHVLYKLAYFFMGFHFLFVFYYKYLIKNIRVSHFIDDDHIFLREQINCQIRVENKGKLPVLYLKIVESLPVKLSPEEKKKVLFLKPGETKTMEFSLKCRWRGFYQIGILEWETGDFLGYRTYVGREEGLSFFVFPHMLEMGELGLPSRLPYGDIRWPQPIYKDPYQMIGVRDYQPTDSLRKIHWKASAHSGKLQVRENQSAVSLETAIILNLDQRDYPLKYLERKVELAVTAAASLAAVLNRLGQSYSFRTNGYNSYLRKDSGEIYGFPVGSGELHLQKILEMLACIEVSEKGEPLSRLLSEQLDLSWGGNIIIITEKDTTELIQIANSLTSRGYSVKLLLLGDRVKHPQFLYRSLTAPLSIYQLSREEDIYGI